jgi:hypothetical protein
MTFEQYLATLIVASALACAAASLFAIVVALHAFMEDAEARERRRRGARLEAGMDGVDSARSEDADRAAALRVFRETGWMAAPRTRRGR